MKDDLDYDIVIKIVLMGNTSVGKTNLIQKFTKGYAIENQPPTIGMDFLSREVTLNGRKLKVQYWDTAGQEKYRSITHTYFKVAQGIILVYDVTNRESFESLNYWVNEIEENCESNKIDLISSREVPTEEAQQFADNYNYKFFEVSALNDEQGNVADAFNTLLNDTAEIIEKEQEQQLKDKKNRVQENNKQLNSNPKTKKKCCQLIMTKIDQKYQILNGHEKPNKQIACFFLIMSSMIGIGFLTLPYHLKQNGIIMGSFIIFISGLCCLYGGFLITRVFCKIENKNFNDIIKINLGTKYEQLFVIDIVFYLIFTTTIYFIFSNLKSRQNL